jgi:hypothetical protein
MEVRALIDRIGVEEGVGESISQHCEWLLLFLAKENTTIKLQ